LLKSLLDDGASRANEIHVTDLTGCLRKAWYSKKQPAPEYVHEKLARWMGTAIHAHAEGSDEQLDSELPLHWDGLVGTADVVYKDGTVCDFKSSRWIYPEKLPYGSHSLQVNIYSHMLRKMGRDPKRLFIQYIDASGPTKCRKCKVPVRAFPTESGYELKCPSCFQFIKGAHLGAVMIEVPLTDADEIEAYITQRKEQLETALMLDLPPEREAGWLCSYCSHRTGCDPEINE
jgi:CRISPR/Cas system-associated exonuclease Cas4 (RecB family)